jgi:hypothetical protein
MDQWTDLATRAERRHGIVVVDDLIRSGASRMQIQRWREEGRLVPCGYGSFRIGGAPVTYAGRVLAAIEEFPDASWASHRTVARLCDLGITCPADLVEITRPTGLSAERSSARVHRSTRVPEHHTTVMCGVPALTVSRTLFDLARTLPDPVLLRALDRGLIRGLCTVPSVWQVFHDLGGRGRPGTRRMREVLNVLGSDHVPAASELEKVGMALLADRGIEWQVSMSDDRGYLRRVDGLHRDGRIVVEFDGPQHGREPQRSLDRDGDRRLRAMGFSVLRFRWDDVTIRSGEALVAFDTAAAP